MAKKEKLPIKIMGDAPCPTCGTKVKLKRNGGGFLYIYCLSEADGGCGGGTTSKSKKADITLAQKCTKWVDPKDRAMYLASAPAPTPAAADPAPVQDEKLAPAPKKSWWDREVL